ncbi:MAG: kinase [Chlamydiae bacterium]|nr:kinase [Chlamydiota bacterium]
MIISQTPVRISFLGGGTDYPSYFRQHGGATLSATIDRYTLITVHPLTQFEDHLVRIHYSQLESVRDVDEIQHPSARECLRFLGIKGGVEIHYVSDLPARTGLGSSSSATVGLLHALHAFKGEMVSREQLAQEAVYVEQELIKERVGSQDQYACALGGFNLFEFKPDGQVHINPVTMTKDRKENLRDRLMLLYTGIRRHAHEVLGEQMARTESGQNSKELQGLKAIAGAGLEMLSNGNSFSDFGALLHEGWMLKRGLSNKITSSWIDELYEKARKAGALGGKLLGAGGGGFLLLYVEPDLRDQVKAALPELREAQFSFEDSGSRIVFYRD